jgi:hypothetical protein
MDLRRRVNPGGGARSMRAGPRLRAAPRAVGIPAPQGTRDTPRRAPRGSRRAAAGAAPAGVGSVVLPPEPGPASLEVFVAPEEFQARNPGGAQARGAVGALMPPLSPKHKAGLGGLDGALLPSLQKNKPGAPGPAHPNQQVPAAVAGRRRGGRGAARTPRPAAPRPRPPCAIPASWPAAARPPQPPPPTPPHTPTPQPPSFPLHRLRQDRVPGGRAGAAAGFAASPRSRNRLAPRGAAAARRACRRTTPALRRRRQRLGRRRAACDDARHPGPALGPGPHRQNPWLPPACPPLPARARPAAPRPSWRGGGRRAVTCGRS